MDRRRGRDERLRSWTSTATHWINGKPWTARRSQRGDIYNPATGQVSGTVDFGGAAEVGAAVGPRRPRPCPAGGRRRWSAGRRDVRVPRADTRHARRPGRADHRRARQGRCPTRPGEVARGLEVVEFACGIPHLLKGGVLGERLHRRGCATRSASRSAWWRASPRSTSRPWCRCGCTPSRWPAGTRSCSSRRRRTRRASVLMAELLADAGLPDGAFNVVHGGKEAVDALLTHPDVKGVSFVGSTPIARYVSQTGDRARASASRPWAGPRTTWWCCPTPTWTWPRTPRCRRDSARRASGAWPSRSSSRSTRSATSWSRRSASGSAGCGSGPGDDERLRDGPAGHPRAPGQGRHLPGLRRRGGRDAGRRRPRAPGDRRRGRRLLARPDGARPRRPRP